MQIARMNCRWVSFPDYIPLASSTERKKINCIVKREDDVRTLTDLTGVSSSPYQQLSLSTCSLQTDVHQDKQKNMFGCTFLMLKLRNQIYLHENKNYQLIFYFSSDIMGLKQLIVLKLCAISVHLQYQHIQKNIFLYK